MKDIDEIRRENLRTLEKEAGGVTAAADLVPMSVAQFSNLRDGARDSKTGKPRGMRKDTARKIEAGHKKPVGWLDTDHSGQPSSPISLDNNPSYPAVRRVKFKLSAGASGFGIEYLHDEEDPIVFQRAWYDKRGLRPEKLFAVKVINHSMEPGLHDGDTVVVNTAQQEPKDGIAFAVNYEGELVVKRLVRDQGLWWLSSDNPDQSRYPRKVCDEHCHLIGEIVHKQSERI
jgi:phage repressor protein C with HTH and peptisase S24 domain